MRSLIVMIQLLAAAFGLAVLMLFSTGLVAEGLDDARAGTVAASLGNHSLAIQLFTFAIGSGDLATRNLAIAYMKRGTEYAALGDNSRALADYDQAQNLEPNIAAVYFNRGLVYRALGDNDRAISDYTEALRQDSDFTEALNNRGAVYHDLGDDDRAISNYTAALSLDPSFVPALNNRGVAYSALGKYDLAIADYTEALQLQPNNAVTYVNRGNLYYKLDDYQRAIADFDEALRLNPADVRACLYRRAASDALRNADYTLSNCEPPQDFDQILGSHYRERICAAFACN